MKHVGSLYNLKVMKAMEGMEKSIGLGERLRAESPSP